MTHVPVRVIDARRGSEENETHGDDATDEPVVTTLSVERGTSLRNALLDAGFEVYGTVSARVNCGGRGLCGTCGVRIDPAPDPDHWHDAAAERFGYPRLSCRITVDRPLTVRLVDKLVWGQLLPRRSGRE